jgi:hypothetical protein
MKKITIKLLSIFILGLLIFSCDSKDSKKSKNAEKKHAEAELDKSLTSAPFFDYIPPIRNHMYAGNNLELVYEYYKSSDRHFIKLYYNGLDSYDAQMLGVKSSKEKMEILVRYRQLNKTSTYPENFAEYYLITIDEKSTSSEKLSTLPDLSDFHFFNPSVTENKVNFRNTPDLHGKIFGQYQADTVLNLTGNIKNYMKINDDPDYWYGFNFNGTERWIFGRYLSFQKSFELTKKLFTEPTKFVGVDVKRITYDKDIKNLPLENTTGAVNYMSVYNAGNSQLQIVDDSNENKIICRILNGDELVSIISGIEHPVYSPVSECFYYVQTKNYSLHAINIKTAKEVSLIDKNLKYPPDEIYLDDGFAKIYLNKTKDKLYYLKDSWSDDFDKGQIEAIDLKTMEHKKIKTGAIITDFPNYVLGDFVIIDDENYYLALYEPKTDNVIIAWYNVSDEKQKLIDSIKIEDVSLWSGDFFQTGDKIIFYCFGRYNSYELIANYNKIEKIPFEGGGILNCFTWNEKDYFASIKAEKEYASEYTIFVYDKETCELIKRKTFKPLNGAWGVFRAGIQDDKILAEDIISK